MKKLHFTLDLYQEAIIDNSKEIIIKGVPDLGLGEALFIFSPTKIVKVFITGLNILNDNYFETKAKNIIETKISFVVKGSSTAISKAA
jgi:hypothetical protein